VKAWAASAGATILSLGVREGNQQALMAYLSVGMRLSGEWMPEAGRLTNVIVVMVCDLRPNMSHRQGAAVLRQRPDLVVSRRKVPQSEEGRGQFSPRGIRSTGADAKQRPQMTVSRPIGGILFSPRGPW
jgi:hypothetical protein